MSLLYFTRTRLGCYVEDDWSKARIISDIDMQLVIEMGTHGGISYIAHRYAKANNKYMRDCNTETETSYITYLDANNLYGWAMIQALPTGAFKWLKQATIRDLANLTEDSERGVILEVDLEYSEELYDLHNEYPVAAEKIKVTKEMLSPYCEELRSQFNLSIGQVSKLIPTLSSKKNCVVHKRNLQLYLALGLRVTKIYSVLQSCLNIRHAQKTHM